MTFFPDLKKLDERLFLLRTRQVELISHLNKQLGLKKNSRDPDYQNLKLQYESLKNEIEDLQAIKETHKKEMMQNLQSSKDSVVRVVVVDDDADDREFICDALSNLDKNLDIITFNSGKDFIDELQQGGVCPHLILTDLRMPVCNGFDVINTVKNLKGTQNIPVVVISTSGNPDDVSRAKELGATAYYVKPYAMEDYTTITNSILSGQWSGSKFNFQTFELALHAFKQWLLNGAALRPC